MKRSVLVLLAVILSVTAFCIPVSAAKQTRSLDYIFDDQLGSLDYFHELSPSYMAFRVSRDLYELYLPDDLGEDEYEYPISAEIYENYLFTLFEVSDVTLNAVRLEAGYNEAEKTYVLNFIGGFGGMLPPREYQGFKNNGDGTYSVFYATINYLYLPDSEYDNISDLDWPSEYEYNGKIYENSPDGYVYIDGVLKSGRVYTVSYNEKTGIVRLIAQNDYTEADLPESFGQETVPAVTRFEMRHDLGVSFDIGDEAMLGSAIISAAQVKKGETFDQATAAMKDIANDFTVYSISAKTDDWYDVTVQAEITVTFDIPNGYKNPAVYLVNKNGTAKLVSTADKENGKISAKTSSFGTFVVCDSLLPDYVLGDVNNDGEIDKFDYIAVKRNVMGTLTLDATKTLAADVNGSGAVDKFDYILVKRHVMGTFAIGE